MCYVCEYNICISGAHTHMYICICICIVFCLNTYTDMCMYTHIHTYANTNTNVFPPRTSAAFSKVSYVLLCVCDVFPLGVAEILPVSHMVV